MGNFCDACFNTGYEVDDEKVGRRQIQGSQAFPGRGQALGTADGAADPEASASRGLNNNSTARTQTSKAVDRDQIAAAAEKRSKDSAGNLSLAQADQLKKNRTKQDLIGSIQHYCQLNGDEEPFGLASCSEDVLRKRLQHEKDKYFAKNQRKEG